MTASVSNLLYLWASGATSIGFLAILIKDWSEDMSDLGRHWKAWRKAWRAILMTGMLTQTAIGVIIILQIRAEQA